MVDQFSKVINIANSFSSDVLVLVVAFIIFFAFSVYFGRNRTVSLVFAYYPAVLLYKSFPYLDKLIFAHGDQLVTLNKIIVFLVFFVPLYIIISRFIFIESLHLSRPNFMHNIHLVRNLGLSMVCLSIFVLFSYTVISLNAFHHFSPLIDNLFSTPIRSFYLNLVPLILLAIV